MAGRDWHLGGGLNSYRRDFGNGVIGEVKQNKADKLYYGRVYYDGTMGYENPNGTERADVSAQQIERYVKRGSGMT